MKHTLVKTFSLLAVVVTLTACQQYLERSDTLSMTSGDAQAVNEANMMVDPWPGYSENTDLDVDGERLNSAINAYKAGPERAGTQQTQTTTIQAPVSN